MTEIFAQLPDFEKFEVINAVIVRCMYDKH